MCMITYSTRGQEGNTWNVLRIISYNFFLFGVACLMPRIVLLWKGVFYDVCDRSVLVVQYYSYTRTIPYVYVVCNVY